MTGGNGYVGSWVVQKLLDKGLTVHVTVRDIKDKNKTHHLQNMSVKSKGTIKLFEADLLVQGSFEKAMKSCDTVFHTAAPFNWKYTNATKEFYHPVVDGTKNVLETVKMTKSVKRTAQRCLIGKNSSIQRSSMPMEMLLSQSSTASRTSFRRMKTLLSSKRG